MKNKYIVYNCDGFVQVELLKVLMKLSKNTYIIGGHGQSIYKWFFSRIESFAIGPSEVRATSGANLGGPLF